MAVRSPSEHPPLGSSKDRQILDGGTYHRQLSVSQNKRAQCGHHGTSSKLELSCALCLPPGWSSSGDTIPAGPCVSSLHSALRTCKLPTMSFMLLSKPTLGLLRDCLCQFHTSKCRSHGWGTLKSCGRHRGGSFALKVWALGFRTCPVWILEPYLVLWTPRAFAYLWLRAVAW